MGSPRVSAISRSTSTGGMPSRSSSAPIAFGPERPGLDHDAQGLLLGLGQRGAQHPQPPGLLFLPAQHEQQRPVGEPPHQVGQQAEG